MLRKLNYFQIGRQIHRAVSQHPVGIYPVIPSWFKYNIRVVGTLIQTYGLVWKMLPWELSVYSDLSFSVHHLVRLEGERLGDVLCDVQYKDVCM